MSQIPALTPKARSALWQLWVRTAMRRGKMARDALCGFWLVGRLITRFADIRIIVRNFAFLLYPIGPTRDFAGMHGEHAPDACWQVKGNERCRLHEWASVEIQRETHDPFPPGFAPLCEWQADLQHSVRLFWTDLHVTAEGPVRNFVCRGRGLVN